MRCNYCGRSNRRKALDCSSCGAPLPQNKNAAAEAAAGELVAVSPEMRRRSKRGVVVILIIGALVAAGAVLIFILVQ